MAPVNFIWTGFKLEISGLVWPPLPRVFASFSAFSNQLKVYHVFLKISVTGFELGLRVNEADFLPTVCHSQLIAKLCHDEIEHFDWMLQVT